jgi:hypothetical protein
MAASTLRHAHDLVCARRFDQSVCSISFLSTLVPISSLRNPFYASPLSHVGLSTSSSCSCSPLFVNPSYEDCFDHHTLRVLEAPFSSKVEGCVVRVDIMITNYKRCNNTHADAQVWCETAAGAAACADLFEREVRSHVVLRVQFVHWARASPATASQSTGW